MTTAHSTLDSRIEKQPLTLSLCDVSNLLLSHMVTVALVTTNAENTAFLRLVVELEYPQLFFLSQALSRNSTILEDSPNVLHAALFPYSGVPEQGGARAAS